MKILAPLLLTFLLCSCAGPKRVSTAEFKRQYAWVGQPQTMHDVAYLGHCEGRAYLRVRSMSTINKNKWSDKVIYVELSALDPGFRDALSKTEATGTH